MQPTLLITIASAFCLGFLFGYFVRAVVSWRRRRRASRRTGTRDSGIPSELGFRLQRPVGQDGTAGNDAPLDAAVDAPALAALEIPSHRKTDVYDHGPEQPMKK